MIKWGFIGCGDVVEKKSGDAFILESKSEVVAVMRRDLEKAKDYAQRHNIKEYYDDADKIIFHDDIDAIYIATTPHTHMSYAKRAIEAGKAVYVEKPMGINLEECEEVIELAKSKNIPVFIAYYRRALPFFNHIKNLLDSGEIGDIRTVNILQYKKAPAKITPNWRRDEEIAGGGLFHDLGCHTLDILDYLISPIELVHGFNSNQRKLYNSDDTVSCTFIYENGVIGTGLWCFDASAEFEQVQIIGNNGIIEFPVYGNKLTITKGDKSEEVTITQPSLIQEPMVHNVINTLLGEDSALSTAETAVRTVKVMEKILNK